MSYFYKGSRLYSESAKKAALLNFHHRPGEEFVKCDLVDATDNAPCVGFVIQVIRDNVTNFHPTNYKPKIYSTVDGIYRAATSLKISPKDIIVWAVVPREERYVVPSRDDRRITKEQSEEIRALLSHLDLEVSLEWKSKQHLIAHIKAT